MPAAGFDFLSALNVSEIMNDIQDVRVLPQELLFLNRLNRVPSLNNQLLGKFQGRIQIADLVAPNSSTPTYKAGRWTAETNALTKMKIGTHFTEDELEEWLDLLRNPFKDPEGIFAEGVMRRVVMDQIQGLEWRMEWLAVAMATDGYYGLQSYNRLGFGLTGAALPNPTWGMPTDLKFTMSPQITDTVNAQPINTILYARYFRKTRYGMETNRITMPTPLLQSIISTAEFQAKVRQLLAPNESYINFSEFSEDLQKNLVSRLLNMDIVLYDGRYWSEDDAGNYTSYPFLPLFPSACMILDDKGSDRNNAVHDFGIGTAMEGRISKMLPNGGVGGGIVGDIPAGVAGPVSYAYVNPTLDPVDLTIFSAAKGWPRKYKRACESVIFTGPINELVPITDIVPQ